MDILLMWCYIEYWSENLALAGSENRDWYHSFIYLWIMLRYSIYFSFCAVENVKWITYQPKTQSSKAWALSLNMKAFFREFRLQWSFWCRPFHLKCPWSKRRREENRIGMFSLYGYSTFLSDFISAAESLDQFNSFTSSYYFLRWNLSEQPAAFLNWEPCLFIHFWV